MNADHRGPGGLSWKFSKLGQDARTILVSVIACSVVAGPSAAAAAYVANADKVDNKHAVGSGATLTARKGKLVATDGNTGLLPNDIIAKAVNADKIDGLDSTAFLPASGQAADAAQLEGRPLDRIRTFQVTASSTTPQALDGAPSSKASITITTPVAGSV